MKQNGVSGDDKCPSEPPTNGHNDKMRDVTPTVRWIGERSMPVCARIEGPANGQVWLVTGSQVIVGRQSTHAEAHIPIAANSYVSRAHLVLTRGDDNQWTVACNGKNGVFIDNTLCRREETNNTLPKQCMLRFPSTELQLHFHSFLTSPVDDDTKLTDSGFASPNVASSPTMPRGSPPSRNDDSGAASDTSEHSDKPCYSYAQLIIQAIASAVDRKLTLSGIYSFITRNYSYYKYSDKGWQNSIRHNLSLSRQFVRLQREDQSKGSYWRLNAEQEESLILSAYVKRRRSKGRADASSESPSPITNGDGGVKVEETKLDGRQFTFSPLPRTGHILHTTQSAPSSPGFIAAAQHARSFGTHVDRSVNAAACNDDAAVKREPHTSGSSVGSNGNVLSTGGGSTFRVSASTRDGRNRLQLCHSPPEYVPVARADMSALHMLQERSRSQRALLQQYRGGSKSLSTTPVRELLASSASSLIRAQQPSTSAANGESIMRALMHRSPEPRVVRKRRNESGNSNNGTKRVTTTHPALVTATTTSDTTRVIDHMAYNQGVVAAAQYFSHLLTPAALTPGGLLMRAPLSNTNNNNSQLIAQFIAQQQQFHQ
jgi:pSer/pThr/pTyr-binding forkhead associated (FHA) protein